MSSCSLKAGQEEDPPAAAPYADDGHHTGEPAGDRQTARDDDERCGGGYQGPHNHGEAEYLITQLRVIVTYLRLLVFPMNQNLDYDYPLFDSFFAPRWSSRSCS